MSETNKRTGKDRKNARVARNRFLKNIIIWLFGVLFIPSVLAVALVLIPINTYVKLATNEETVINHEIGEKAVIPALLSIGDYTLGDINVVTDAFVGAIQESELGGILKVDKEKLNAIYINALGISSVKDCLRIEATLTDIEEFLSFNLGTITELNVFNEFELVLDSEKPNISEPFNYNYYYYFDGENYHRAFDDTGAYVEGVDENTELYYPALSKINVTEFPKVFDDSFLRIEINELMSTFDASYGEDSDMYKVLEGKRVGDMGAFEAETIKLSDVVDVNGEGFAKLVDIVCETVEIEEGEDPVLTEEGEPIRENVTLGQVSRLDIDKAKLSSVIDRTENNQKFWAILEEATTPTGENGEILVGDLDNINVDAVKIGTVIDYSSDNANVINKLIEKETQIGEVGVAVKRLTLYEVYGGICFTENEADKDNERKFIKTETPEGKVQFVENADGTYYIHKNAGIWLILAFDGDASQTLDGRSTVYTENELTLGDLEENGTVVTDKINGATVRELMDCKVMAEVDFSNDEIYKWTFEEFINHVATIL